MGLVQISLHFHRGEHLLTALAPLTYTAQQCADGRPHFLDVQIKCISGSEGKRLEAAPVNCIDGNCVEPSRCDDRGRTRRKVPELSRTQGSTRRPDSALGASRAASAAFLLSGCRQSASRLAEKRANILTEGRTRSRQKRSPVFDNSNSTLASNGRQPSCARLLKLVAAAENKD